MIIFLVLSFVCSISDAEKRVLVGDSDAVSQEINKLQSEIQEILVTVGNQKRTIDSLRQVVDGLRENSTYQQEIINTQQNTIDEISKGANAIYTRWGRTDCPNGNETQLVYSGFVGGSLYSAPGGASNSLCLSPEPVWGPHKNSRPQHPAFIYGSEIETASAFGISGTAADVPCAVCRNPSYSAVIMIPGRNQCYDGWREAYHGVLVSGYPIHAAASEYICMDSNPQPLLGGSGINDDQHVFYAVLSKCGSLPCPPYANDKVVSCVVCMI